MSTIFPKWTNGLPTAMAVGATGALSTVVGIVWYYFTPAYWAVGYEPKQPGGGFNHQIHAGKLGLDCRYCHTHIEESPEANIPAVATCYGCHENNKLVNQQQKEHAEKTQFIRDSFEKDETPLWRRVHKVPDYVRNFPHNAHISAGVSCYSCHGNIARQVVVNQKEPLSMGWCLECHRDPASALVPKKGDTKPDGTIATEDQITRLFEIEKFVNKDDPNAVAALVTAQEAAGKKLLRDRKLNPPENCGACHY